MHHPSLLPRKGFSTSHRNPTLAIILALTVALAGSLVPRAAPAQQNSPAPAPRILEGVGAVHHPVSTRTPEAQRYFDHGLAFMFGFNHDEAARTFQRAADLDPTMAMAYWGIAAAVGPNYNLPVDPEREKQAYDAVQKALRFSQNGPANERAYIEALARRYTNQPNANYHQLEMDYHAAMREVMKRYPDDLDAATLCAESGMNLRPWKLWNADGTPAPGTEEIVATLESVLKRNSEHIGANHLYIHAVEASNRPERALPSAMRLAALAPAQGHLVHMPAHIYIRTGDHEASKRTNEMAAAADEKYIAETNAQGIYPMMYYTHNLHFIALENAMLGRYADALKAAQRVQDHVAPHAASMPMLDGFMPMPALVLVRFNRWDEIMKLPQPAANLPMSNGMWHYARAVAFASNGNVLQAQTELATLRKLAPQMAKIPTNTVGPRNAGIIPQIAEHVIQARLAEAQNDEAAAINHLRQAVVLQDSMDYTEPPDWFYPVRESLGAALLIAGNARDAEQVFRADLEKNPRNPRSLFGLMEALKAQGRTEDATAIRQQFDTAWKHSDISLQVADLLGGPILRRPAATTADVTK